MQRVPVPLPGADYEILIGSGILAASLEAFLRSRRPGSPCVIVTDTAVGQLYGEPLLPVLADLPQAVHLCSVPPGEGSKSLEQLGGLYHEFARLGLDRDSVVIALGGGVVGDLAGFAAATYLRGIDLVQVPTTLLAQVDSSVGGKTGIDLPEGKNLVGAFLQPRQVVADLDTLGSLPSEQLRAGLAEVIKYGMIDDPGILDTLEGNRAAILAGAPEALAPLVVRSCEIKAAVVVGDERETGRRAILNFGHTVGHALEAVTGYHDYLHGEAVAIGMVAAARLSRRLAGLAPAAEERLRALTDAYGLPTRPREPVAPERILDAARRDKKARGGSLRFVLARAPGDVDLFPVAEADVTAVLKECWT